MSDETPPLLEEDYDAAREVANKTAAALEKEPTAKLIELFAKERARLGAYQFDLVNGLKPPRHVYDQLVLEIRLGTLDKDEFDSRIRDAESLPLSLEMVAAYFDELDAKVSWYSRLLQLAHEPTADGNEHDRQLRADRFTFEIGRKVSLPGRQIQLVHELVEELRIEQRLGLAQLGIHTAPSASGLVLNVTNLAANSWRAHAEIARRSQTSHKYAYAITASELFVSQTIPDLPRPGDLQALLHQELALSRSKMKNQDSTGNKRVEIINNVSVEPHFHVSNGINVELEATAEVDSSPEKTGGKKPQTVNEQRPRSTSPPKLKNWAVGIEHGNRWWLFHRKNGGWQQRGLVAIPGGNAAALMEQLAEGGGAMSKAEARQRIRPNYVGEDRDKLSRAITEALKKARQAIRKAIAKSAQCEYQEVSSPIPHDHSGWRAVIEIGFATLDVDRNTLIFQLKEDMH
ncbi:hypothetical protein Mal52_29950 [Symmachiella dynata]|uniref:Uncharacterized protein n=1 Tax=Symmachiella dynata TaxID=2527995 RepID=A0A517ZPU9_9PLAN|nr:hypothetical protein [Symmachiella dynata]QDU44512.1 hypothetical protein Mal52_29950 [Symmachiella dynata]